MVSIDAVEDILDRGRNVYIYMYHGVAVCKIYSFSLKYVFTHFIIDAIA